MNQLAPKHGLVALLLLSLCGSVIGQEDATTTPDVPELDALQSTWWTYFETDQAEVGPRADLFFAQINSEIVELTPPNQVIAESVVLAARENLTAYAALLDENQLTLQELPPPADSYSINDLLRLAAVARDAGSGVDARQVEMEREQRVLDGTSARRDLAFKNYVGTTGEERWLAGARLVQARSAQAISERRLELITRSLGQATEYAATADTRVDEARTRLDTTSDEAELERLASRVTENEAAVVSAEEKLRAAEVAAIGLDLETPQGRSQQRLQQLLLASAEVELAIAQGELGQAQALRWWTALQLDNAPDLGVLEEQFLAWSELVRQIRQRELDWKRDTEDELLAVQSLSRDGLDRTTQRLLDQRFGTAGETLARVGELDAVAADLELLSQVVDDAVTRSSGRFRSWLASVSRQLKAAFLRFGNLAGNTLFSVGETPVTGGDIFRVVIILTVAYLLSRGIRHAISRVTRKDFSGTQASLYTVGRLTHYTIFIIAVFLALSSIGLDFSNLALVAGALSVGIGFGLQSMVGNFVSGLIILFEHTLRVGDFIELDTGLRGTVKSINVRSTLINTNDNIDIVVPNSEFVTNRLTNWTLGERILRLRIPFGVAYGSDKELVRKAALEAADNVSYTLAHMSGREPDAWLMDFGDNSLNFVLLVWVNRQGARRPSRTRAAYMWELESKLAEYGIQIPFPQRDLHIRSGWPPAEH